MLLHEEEERDLVNRIVTCARDLLKQRGEDRKDMQTGLVHRECRLGPFLLIEHQRQKLKNGEIKTNGLDLWEIDAGKARKKLSVNYVPFSIKVFDKAGKAPWIDILFKLSKED
ncbi:MAG: hypothetical protein QNK37_06980 [Acidobacteriota bacterium]|nr:hypothetical protein [Acidobacteriota bacterium]